MLTLVPNSGVQFFDFEIDADTLAALRLHFIEDVIEEADGPRPVLILVEGAASGDGALYHPVNGQPVARDKWLTFDGYRGIEPFLGTWTPLPFLRRVTGPPGSSDYDDGPTNWVRIYIEPPSEPLRSASQVRAVLAIDTAIDARSRFDQTRYGQPNSDDVELGARFTLATTPARLGAFLGEAWVHEWIRQEVGQWHTRHGSLDPGARPSDDIARYLVLLDVLKSAAALPALSMVEREVVRDVAVDLILDIGNLTTAAVISQPASDGGRNGRRGAGLDATGGGVTALRQRHLSNPTRVTGGPIPTDLEFDEVQFGSRALSRRSGRRQAFNWPSLARVGVEARALALREGAVPGVTGAARIKRGLMDTAASAAVWRFSRELVGPASALDAPGRIVSGELLSHFQDDGEAARSGVPALRPRFSQSSLMSFFVAELLLQALAQINTPVREAAGEGAGGRRVRRRIGRVVLTTPAAMPPGERTMLVARVEAAIESVWSALGWTQECGCERPNVVQGLDTDLSAQIVYLLDEVSSRYQGDLARFMSLARTAGGGYRGDRSPGLRVASVDIGSAFTNIPVVDYRRSGETAEPTLARAARVGVAGEAVIEAVTDAHLKPHIERALAASGIEAAAELMAAIASEPAHRVLRQRLEQRVYEPCALALIDRYIPTGEASARGRWDLGLAELAAWRGADLLPASALIDAVARESGASGFHLRSVRLSLTRRQLSVTIAGALEGLLPEVASVVGDLACDIVVLTGGMSRIPDVKRRFDGLLAIAPHRVINLYDRNISALRLNGSTGEDRDELWLAGALGSSLAGPLSLPVAPPHGREVT